MCWVSTRAGQVDGAGRPAAHRVGEEPPLRGLRFENPQPLDDDLDPCVVLPVAQHYRLAALGGVAEPNGAADGELAVVPVHLDLGDHGSPVGDALLG